MVIKGSSNELSPPVTTTGVAIARPTNARSFKDYLALGIATCGVGYFPLAPGTWGSALGVGIYILYVEVFNWGLRSIRGYGREADLWPTESFILFATPLLIIVLLISLAGVWAATLVENLHGRKDPGKVVIDEVAGQLITFLFIPFLSPLWLIIVGFVLFRAFDIWKPYPIRKLESLESGLGIMADDVLAGLYAATVLSLVTFVYVLL